MDIAAPGVNVRHAQAGGGYAASSGLLMRSFGRCSGVCCSQTVNLQPYSMHCMPALLMWARRAVIKSMVTVNFNSNRLKSRHVTVWPADTKASTLERRISVPLPDRCSSHGTLESKSTFLTARQRIIFIYQRLSSAESASECLPVRSWVGRLVGGLKLAFSSSSMWCSQPVSPCERILFLAHGSRSHSVSPALSTRT